MFETLKRLYQAGKLTDEKIQTAVFRGWITQEQADTLLNPAPSEPEPPASSGSPASSEPDTSTPAPSEVQKEE